MPLLQLDNITHRFEGITALENLSLSVEQGELLSLLGPSGCGKTTAIRLIAGFLTPAQGRILLSGRDITHLPPEKRNMGMVFQSYALFPHLNVFENVAFGLKARKTPAAEARDKVGRALELVNLPGYEMRQAFQLSGGEQQRVAIARAIAIEPQILLLDEPLSNLDASLREKTRKQLRELISSLGMTAIFVTHDQEEAFALSDRIALLSRGVCQQIGTATELYHRPANEFVASFIGKSNLLSLVFKGYKDDGLIFALPTGNELRLQIAQKERLKSGKTYRLLLRPEQVEFEKTARNAPLICARMVSHRFSGALTEFELEGEGLRLLAVRTGGTDSWALRRGEVFDLFCQPDSVIVLSGD